MKSPLILRSIQELRRWRGNIKGSLGLVPTMGALHAGHLSLIQASMEQNPHTLLSIFVNPTQFAAHEDFDTYPRRLEEDVALAGELGIEAVFAPKTSEIYACHDAISLNPPPLKGYIYEGFHRPEHFAGVLQVVLKLFGLSGAQRAYFGQKDAQQLLLIQQMVREFFLPIEIVACPIVRDHDGLALSSRNAYLSPQERRLALKLPQALHKIQTYIEAGEREVERLYALGMEELGGLEVDYLAFCDRCLQPIEQIRPDLSLILLTARVGKTRLLDNLWI